MIDCPLCSEDCLEYADKFCSNCGQQVSFIFWEGWKLSYLETHTEASFLSHIASNEIAVCCHDHIELCVCNTQIMLRLDDAEDLVKEEDLGDDNIWGKDCISCLYYSSTSCPSYLNWMYELDRLRSAGRLDIPRRTVQCEQYEMYNDDSNWSYSAQAEAEQELTPDINEMISKIKGY